MDDHLRAWLVNLSPKINAEDHTTDAQRDRSLIQQCIDRDGGQCVVSKCSDLLEVCHIYPFALSKKKGMDKQENFWCHLGIFWSPAQIKIWQDLVEGEECGTEFLGNLICLSSPIHEWWKRALCAFKPIDMRDGEGLEQFLTLEFYYLPPPIPYDVVRIRFQPSLSSTLGHAPGGLAVADYEKMESIASGHQFTLKTQNKNTHPLPPWDLLMMQWNLQRIASLRGAAQLFKDQDDGDDEDNEYDKSEDDEDVEIIPCEPGWAYKCLPNGNWLVIRSLE